MPRPARIQFEGATYHVFSRGNRRERLFRHEDDYAAFETIMLEAMRWSGIELFNWGLMPNHFHFNLETPDGNLAEFMQRVQTRFAKYFNRAHRLVGHVFQGRYGARLVDHEAYFQEIVRYVELNPYRLKKGMLAGLGDWKWSSLRHYMQSEALWPEGCRRAFRTVLERFGNDPVSARKALTRFLAEGLTSGRWEDFYRIKDNRFLGEENFVERLKRQNAEPVRAAPRLTLAQRSPEELLQQAQAISGLSLEQFRNSDQMRLRSRWRQAVAYIARAFYRLPVEEISRLLGRDPTTVSHMLRSIKDRREMSEILRLLQALRLPAEGQSCE